VVVSFIGVEETGENHRLPANYWHTMLYGVHLAMSRTPCVRYGMKQTSLYLWYSLFQAKWDRCDRHHHQIWNYV